MSWMYKRDASSSNLVTFDPSTAPPKASETEKASQVFKIPDYAAKPKNKVNDPSVCIS